MFVKVLWKRVKILLKRAVSIHSNELTTNIGQWGVRSSINWFGKRIRKCANGKMTWKTTQIVESQEEWNVPKTKINSIKVFVLLFRNGFGQWATKIQLTNGIQSKPMHLKCWRVKNNKTIILLSSVLFFLLFFPSFVCLCVLFIARVIHMIVEACIWCPVPKCYLALLLSISKSKNQNPNGYHNNIHWYSFNLCGFRSHSSGSAVANISMAFNWKFLTFYAYVYNFFFFYSFSISLALLLSLSDSLVVSPSFTLSSYLSLS